MLDFLFGTPFVIHSCKSKKGGKMKPFLILSIFVAALYASHPVQAFEMGGLQVAGAGCEVPPGGHELIPVSGSSTRFGVPLMINATKLAAPASLGLERKACAMALPVHLAANEKLIVKDVRQRVSLKSAVGAKSSARLEVFLAGQQGQVLKAEIEGKTKTVRSTQTLNDADVVAESDCGKDVIVRANSSAMISGSGAGRVNTQALYLTLEVVNCR